MYNSAAIEVILVLISQSFMHITVARPDLDEKKQQSRMRAQEKHDSKVSGSDASVSITSSGT